MKGTDSIHKRMIHYAHADIDAMYQDLQISKSGYNEVQVEKSREQYGDNSLDGRTVDTILYRLRRAFINPFTVILFVLVCISFVTDVLLAFNFSRNVTTVLIILCMLLISGVIRFIQEMRSKRIVDNLSKIIHSDVMVRRGGKWEGI